jgi:argininosuccinate lyase
VSNLALRIHVHALAAVLFVSPLAAQTPSAGRTPQPRGGRPQPVLSASGEPRDEFYFMTLANKAQVVMLDEEKLIPHAEAQKIAGGIGTVVAEQRKPGAPRSGDYLQFEKLLVEQAGPEGSKLHMGRSRNDLGASVNRLMLRDKVLVVMEGLSDARQSLLAMAAKNVNTIYPAYTHHVQAQPVSFAHYLLALESALDRDAERLREAYQRLNRSPLGSGALGTSGFPLNRMRLMELVGFGSLLENSYDAICVSEGDSKIELASVYALSSIAIGRFAQDVAAQYGDPRPGLYFSDADTGRSSIMPQKRNPGSLEAVRRAATTVLAESQRTLLMAHNTSFGEVTDVRYPLKDLVLEVHDEAAAMYRALKVVFDTLIVDPERTLQKVNDDFSTMTEVADLLLRDAQVPFRIGYNFASAITTFGRKNGKTPNQITYAEYQKIYEDVNMTKLPVTEAQLQHAIDPRLMVANRRGRGGPQPAEVERMIGEHQKRVAADRGWVSSERQGMTNAEASLDAVFTRLAAR